SPSKAWMGRHKAGQDEIGGAMSLSPRASRPALRGPHGKSGYGSLAGSASTKPGLRQPFEEMVARFLRAVLPCESHTIQKRREAHDDGGLALGILVSSQLGIGSSKKRMDEQLAGTPRAAGESAVTGRNGVAVTAEEIVCPAQALRCQEVAVVEAERSFEPRQA